MTLEVDVQFASGEDDLPDVDDLRRWAHAAVSQFRKEAELSIRIVDEEESARLNERYRHKAGPTNVLAFPFDAPQGVAVNLLGDIVICAPVVRREAVDQSKQGRAHFAHMVVHGALHLLGYEHEKTQEAEKMEAQEKNILAALGFEDPYLPRHTDRERS